MFTESERARKKLKLTQEAVARKSKISVRAYRNYEKGLRKPQADIALRIAETLETTVEKLFGESA